MRLPNVFVAPVKGKDANAAFSTQPNAQPFVHVWRAAIDKSGETASARLILLYISRFTDRGGRGASVSYAQICRETGVSRPTAKRTIARLRGRWLHVQYNEGQLTPGVGKENLYDLLLPQEMLERVRSARVVLPGYHGDTSTLSNGMAEEDLRGRSFGVTARCGCNRGSQLG
jgi:Helix-turn-helix domain